MTQEPNGTYTLDGSSVVIQNGRIISGSGPHWNHCRYTGEFRFGSATVFGGPGSAWPHTLTQQWVAQGDLITVDGGRHVWKKIFDCDGVFSLDDATVEIRGGRIIGGWGSHWNHCRYTGEFHDGKAIVYGGPGSAWPHTLSQQWVLQGNVMSVDGGRHVWRRIKN